MLWPGQSLKGTPQIGGRIALAAPRGDAIAEHLPAGPKHLVRGDQRAAGFDLPQQGQQHGRRNGCDGVSAERRKDEGLEALQGVTMVDSCPSRLDVIEPLACDRLEVV